MTSVPYPQHPSSPAGRPGRAGAERAGRGAGLCEGGPWASHRALGGVLRLASCQLITRVRRLKWSVCWKELRLVHHLPLMKQALNHSPEYYLKMDAQ